MRPWARVPRRARVRRGGAAAARPRHHLAGDEPAPGGRTGTPSVDPGVRQARRRERRGRRRRALDGRRARAPARRGPTRPASPASCVVNPALATSARTCWPPAAQAPGPVVPGHRQRHQEAGRRRARLHPHPAQGRPLDAAGAGKAIVPDLPKITAAAAVLPLGRGPRRRRVRRSRHITARVSSRDVTERTLEDSYHVATLDNDAQRSSRSPLEFFVPRHATSLPVEVPADRGTDHPRTAYSWTREQPERGGRLALDRGQLRRARRTSRPPATQEKDNPPAPDRGPHGVPRRPRRSTEAAEERYVPPPPPPLPPPAARPAGRLARPVRLAGGAPGRPVLGIGLPSWVGYLLIGSFLGGFGYLVAHDATRAARPGRRRRPTLTNPATGGDNGALVCVS